MIVSPQEYNSLLHRLMDPNAFTSMIRIPENEPIYDIDLNQSQGASNGPMIAGAGISSAPIIEPMRERVVNRTIEHVVPHVCPVRTRIINHHVFKHTYQPNYSCCEENVCSHVQCGSCCNY